MPNSVDEMKVTLTADTAQYLRDMDSATKATQVLGREVAKVGKIMGKVAKGTFPSAVAQEIVGTFEKDPLLAGVVKGGFDPNAVVNAHLFLLAEAERGLRRLSSLGPGAKQVQENISRREREAASQAATALIDAAKRLSIDVSSALSPGPGGKRPDIIAAEEGLAQLLPALRRLLAETPVPAVRGRILDANIPELSDDVLGVRIERLSEEISQVAGDITKVEQRLAKLRSRKPSDGRRGGTSPGVLEDRLRELERRRSELEAQRQELEDDLSRIGRERGDLIDPGGGRGSGIERSSSGGFFEPAAFRLSLAGGDGSDVLSDLPGMAALAETAAPLRAALARTQALSPALAQAQRQTLDLTDAARDLGFTFASALEDAIVEGQGLSEMLRGLEKDILRVMARTLITEPLATGIQDALRDVFPEAAGTGEGGLGGLVRSGLGGLFGLLRPEGAPESTTPPFVGGDRAGDFGGYFGEDPGDTAKSVAQVAGLGDASGATGEVLRSVLSEGARMAGFEAVSQATAAPLAARRRGGGAGRAFDRRAADRGQHQQPEQRAADAAQHVADPRLPARDARPRRTAQRIERGRAPFSPFIPVLTQPRS